MGGRLLHCVSNAMSLAGSLLGKDDMLSGHRSEFFSSPQSWFKFFNAAVRVGQPVLFATADCYSTLLT